MIACVRVCLYRSSISTPPQNSPLSRNQPPGPGGFSKTARSTKSRSTAGPFFVAAPAPAEIVGLGWEGWEGGFYYQKNSKLRHTLIN